MNTETEMVKIDSIKAWDKNPREIAPDSLERLKRQIKKLGQYKPVLVNQDNIILGGRMTHMATIELGHAMIEIHRVKTKNEDEMIEYLLSDNDEVGKYDEELLAEMLLEHLDFPVDDYNVSVGRGTLVSDLFAQAEASPEDDENKTADQLETYKNNPVKQIVLYFVKQDYEKFNLLLQQAMSEYKTKDGAQTVIKLLDNYEQANG